MRNKNRTTKDTISGAVAGRLVRIRKQLNMTAPEMAARIGISANGYNKNESGVNLPGLAALQMLQKDFDISLDWLYFNKGPMHFKSKLKASEMEAEKEQLNEKAELLKDQEERLEKEAENLKRRGEGAKKFAELETVMSDITDLLEYMGTDPQLRHKVLLDFYSYKKERERGITEMPVDG
ncbi:MAG: helix-turn-helix domain-containing protein [bacterium]|nr:helix-turn-helix domain-containing protein [bacterium]